MHDTKELLKRTGLKATAARIQLLNVLADSGKPLSAKDIHKRISGDLATLYRTFNSFVEKGIVQQVDFKQGYALYELSHENHHHHHLVCVSCGKVEDIYDCEVPTLSKKDLKGYGFESIDEHVLEFFGLCSACFLKKGTR